MVGLDHQRDSVDPNLAEVRGRSFLSRKHVTGAINNHESLAVFQVRLLIV